MILTSTPTSLRRPGAFTEFKFVAAGQQLVPLPLRVAIVAEKSSVGTATVEVPVQVFDEDDGDTKCGKGSFAALMARAAFATAHLKGSSPEIWVCPVAESSGVATQETITVTVATNLAGNLVLQICGVTVIVPCSAGDSVSTIASAISAQLATLKSVLPFTATPAAGVVTCLMNTKGVNGNDVSFATISAPSGVTIAYAQSVAGTGACSITNAVNALYDRRYHAIAVNNHTTTDITTMLTVLADAWSYSQKNYRWFFMGERGSTGTAQTLSAAANDKGVLIINCEQIPTFPGAIAAGAAVAEFAREAPNANLDGDVLPFAPPSGAYAFTAAEIESNLNAGVTPLTPEGSFVKIERLVTTKTTENSAAFEPLRDLAYSRTAAYRAEQLDIGFRTGFVQQTLDAEVLQRVRDMIIGKDRAMEELGYLTGVDDLLDQIQVEKSPSVAGRVVASAPFYVAGPLHQGVFVNILYFS